MANILQAGRAKPEGGGENQITASTRMGIRAEAILLWGRDGFSLAIYVPPLSWLLLRLAVLKPTISIFQKRKKFNRIS
jgi:hypothetical protein